MINAVFYKEWIKTRWLYLIISILSFVFVIYAEMRVGRVIELKGVMHLWDIMLTRETVFIEVIKYVPLAIGILFALFQFVPEMMQKRLKLTLHLPLAQQNMLLTMLFYGIILLLSLFILNYLVLIIYFHKILAGELLYRLLLTALPWYIAGLTAYALTAWICLEPTWKRRILNIAITLGSLRLFYLSDTPEAYNNSLFIFIIMSILTIGFSLISVERFKEGKQD